MTNIAPPTVSRIVQDAIAGRVSIDPRTERILTDDLPGISDGDADSILARARMSSAPAARAALQSALESPTGLSPRAQARLTERLQQKTLDEAQSAVRAIDRAVWSWTSERPTDREVRDTIDALTRVIGNGTPEQQVWARAMRANVYLMAAAFESRGWPAYEATVPTADLRAQREATAGLMRHDALADLRAVAPELKNLDQRQKDEVLRTASHALGADWLVTPEELEMVATLVEGAGNTAELSERFLGMQRHLLASDNPAVLARATELQAFAAALNQAAGADPDLAREHVLDLVRELQRLHERDDEIGEVAGQMLFDLASRSGQLYGVRKVMEKNGLWTELHPDGRDGVVMQTGMKLVGQLDASFMALYTLIPDRLDSRAREGDRPDMVDRIVDRYMDGFESGKYIPHFHALPVRQSLQGGTAEGIDRTVERFVRQAQERIAEEPQLADRYARKVKDLLSPYLDERMPASARERLTAFAATLDAEG